jgi:hypothetical protein
VLPNRPGATAGVLAWVGGRPAYVYGHAIDEVPLADWDDLTVAAVRLRELEPLRSWQLDLDDGDNGLSLRWDGRSAALPTGHRQYEQTGHVVGRLVLNGHPFAVDGVGHRRHEWGAPATPALRAIGFLGPADAPRPDTRSFAVDTTGGGHTGGFVHDDGADHAITAADIDGDVLRLTTDDGRTTTITARPHGEPVPLQTTQQQLMRFSADDGLEGYGLVERATNTGAGDRS